MTDYYYGDPHFSHKNICKFSDHGQKVRPWETYEEMDVALVDLFNNTVAPRDRVFFLGDVCINRRGLKILEQLNCKNLFLIKGNHDVFRLEEYTPYFKDIMACYVKTGIIFTHIPVHESQVNRFGVNVHGHLHNTRIMKHNAVDLRYHCVSIEHTDFKPISHDELIAKIRNEGGYP